MRLILTRHGETEENQAGILQGHLPGTLSTKGIEQVEKLAEWLKREHIDYIYSSDLRRSADTAGIIAIKQPKAVLEFTEALRERHLGEYQGKKKSDFGWKNTDHKASVINPKHGERMDVMYERAKYFTKNIIKMHPDDTVLLVGHGGVNKAIIAAITGKEPSEHRSIESQHNTSVNIFEIHPDGSFEVELSNSIEHLG